MGLFLLSRRLKLRGSLLAIMLFFVAAMFMTAQPVSVQSADSCSANADSSSSSASSSQQPDSGIQLIDDAYDLTAGVIFGMAIAANDLFPEGDPMDWATLDLDPSTPEVDIYSMLYHPDYPSYECGSVWYNTPPSEEEGEVPDTVYVSVLEQCYSYEANDSIPPLPQYTFQYTAASLSGKKAPEPATVTVALSGVIALDHHEFDLSWGGSDSVNVADDAVTFTGTIDPSSVDLDPSTPGQQTSITVPTVYDPDIDVTIEVDSNGLVTMTTSPNFNLCNQGAVTEDIPYTIKNSLGTTSNIAFISAYYDVGNCG